MPAAGLTCQSIFVAFVCARKIDQAAMAIGGAPGLELTCLASKRCARVITAHRRRAFLLASATAATCQPDRSRKARAQRLIGSLRLCALNTTDLAPCTNRLRRYESPRRVMRPSLVLPPLESWRGVMPHQAPN